MYKIELDWNPPTGNKIKKLKHWAYKKLREEWVNRLKAYFVVHKTPFPGNRKVYLILERPVRKIHLDYDNLVWTFKPALDALQETNVLVDDNVEMLSAVYLQTKSSGGIRIWITTKPDEFLNKKRALELLQGS